MKERIDLTGQWKLDLLLEVEYDRYTSISTINSERDLNVEVDQIMQSVFGELDIYSDNFEEARIF